LGRPAAHSRDRHLASGTLPPRLRLQPFIGGRYQYFGMEIKVRRPILDDRLLTPVSHSAAPILGLRGFLDIDEHPQILSPESRVMVGWVLAQDGNDPDNSVFLGGEVAGRIDRMPSVDALLKEISADAERVIQGLSGFISGD